MIPEHVRFYPYFLSRESLGQDHSQTYPSLTDHITADLCIIGGGIAGLFTAYWLADLGVNVVLLDKGILGHGATGRNTGFILTGTAEHFSRLSGLIGEEKTTRLWNITARNHDLLAEVIAAEHIDCEYERCGSLILSMSESEAQELKTTYEMLSERGFDCTWLSTEDLKVLLGEPMGNGAVRMNRDGALHPIKFIRSLSTLLKKRTVSIYEETNVSMIQSHPHSNDIRVHTSEGYVDCALALLTTNAHIRDLLPDYKDVVFPVRGQAFATEPLQKRMFREVIYANFGYEYWRQLPDGRLIIGGFREQAKEQELTDSEDLNVDLFHGLHDYFADLFPPLKECKVTHAWAGTMGFSQDGLPLLGSSRSLPHLYIMGGFTGHGLGFAALLSQMAAQLMVNGEAEDSDLFHTRRFHT
jgi:glycine/D-amino acid oxidase-like deaminating enzyme